MTSKESTIRRLYLEWISGDDKYGSELCKMMDYYDVTNLHSLTTDEIKEYYLHVMLHDRLPIYYWKPASEKD